MIQRNVGGNPSSPSSETPGWIEARVRTVNPPERFHGQLLGRSGVANDPDNPAIHFSLKLAKQGLEGPDIARGELLQDLRMLFKQLHFLLYIRLLERGRDGFMFFRHAVRGATRGAIECAASYNLNCMYSERLLDHFQNPRNAGDVSSADAIAEIDNPACGDVLRLTLKISAGRVAEIRFKAKGCVPSMACASALTEMVSGKSLEEARTFSREDLIAAVGGLPQASTHAAQLALDALSSALDQLNPTRRVKAID